MALNFNGTPVAKVYYNDVELYQLFYQDTLVWEAEPITESDYILYTYDPYDGYHTENARRYVTDKGNTLFVGASGQWSGSMHSGRSVQLGENSAVLVPLDATVDSEVFIYTNKDNEEHLISSQPVIIKAENNFNCTIEIEVTDFTPSSGNLLYIIINGQLNSIFQGWRITTLTDEPTARFNILQDSSIVNYISSTTIENRITLNVRIENDIVYINDEDTGALVDYTASEDSYLFISTRMSDGIHFSQNIFSLAINGEIFNLPASFGKPYLISSQGTRLDLHSNADPLAMWQGAITVNNAAVVYFDYATNTHVQDTNLSSTHYIFNNQNIGHFAVLNVALTADDLALLDNEPELLARLAFGDTTTGLSITPADVYEYYPNMEKGTDAVINGIGGSVADIYGDFTRNKNLPFGIQPIRFVGTGNTPRAFITEKFVDFAGQRDRIDTGVNTDGTLNFSMLEGFKGEHSGIYQVITGSAGTPGTDNMIRLAVNEDGTYQVVIGQNVFDATPFIQDTFPVHMMGMTYDASTKEVFGVVDGGTLQSFGTITWDGSLLSTIAIGALHDGNYPFTGQVGRGILAAAILTQEQFNDAWYAMALPYMSRSLFLNDEFDYGTHWWTYNPAYPATITDNGDGSIHLQSNSNYGSIKPVTLPNFDPSLEYTFEIEVANVSGNGKYSIQHADNSWTDIFTFTADGVYTGTAYGDIKSIDIGADSDDTFNCDFLYSTAIEGVVIPPDTPPEVRDVAISGTPQVGQEYVCTYLYYDAENDPESGTTFQWYRSDDGGTTPQPISGATSDRYTAAAEDENYQIACEVTPANTLATGTPVMSNWSEVITAQPTNNMLSNGSFDTDATGWELADTLSWVDGHIYNDGTAREAQLSQTEEFMNEILQPDITYQISFDIGGITEADHVQIALYAGRGYELLIPTSSYYLGNNTAQFTTPADLGFFDISLFLRNDGEPAEAPYWIDNIVLIQV